MKEKRNSKSGEPKTSPAFTRRTALRVLFILLCLAGSALGLWLFWTDLNHVLYRTNEEAAGTLSYKRHTVQRRFENRLVWNTLPRESPVYNGDLIRTAELSDALIAFGSDTLSLSENTLVHIRFDKQTGTSIELLGGSVNLHSQSGRTLILAGGRELRPEAGGSLEVRGGPETASIHVLRGTALLSTPSGKPGLSGNSVPVETERLEAGYTAVAGAGGLGFTEDPLVVQSPLPDESSEDHTLRFSWINKNAAAGEGVRIEVALDRRFTDLAYQAEEYDPQVSAAELTLSPGVWRWRVFLVRGGAEPLSVPREGRYTILAPSPETPVTDNAAAVPGADASGGTTAETAPGSANAPGSAGTSATGTPAPVLASPLILGSLSSAAPTTASPLLLPALEPEASFAQAAQAQTRTAQTRTARTVPPNSLSRPGGLYPPAGTVVDGAFLLQERRFRLSWNRVDGADAYICTVRQENTVIMNQVREPLVTFEQMGALANGPCSWQVEAVQLDRAGNVSRRGGIAESDFIIDVPRPSPPEIDNPGVIYGR